MMLFFLKTRLAIMMLACVGLDLRADITAQAINNGYGLLTLTQPITRKDLAGLKTDSAPTLWVTLPNGTAAGIDWDVTRLLPDTLLKVYSMSSKSPQLIPGTIKGSLTLTARADKSTADNDWTLQPNEVAEKQTLVMALAQRYQKITPADLASVGQYYGAPQVLTDVTKSMLQKQQIHGLRPAIFKAGVGRLNALSFSVSVVGADGLARTDTLRATAADLTALLAPVQIPLGNYNYDISVIEALDKPNELAVASGQGLDLFALACSRYGPKAVAAVELICYNGFTSNITASGQGLLLVPPDGDLSTALTTGTALYACFETPVIIALRKPGQSPAEAASGVLGITVILK